MTSGIIRGRAFLVIMACHCQRADWATGFDGREVQPLARNARGRCETLCISACQQQEQHDVVLHVQDEAACSDVLLPLAHGGL